MALTLIVDETDRPAFFGVAAACHAAGEGARFIHTTVAQFDLARDADAQQYVFRDGGLGPSGLFFVEAILGTGAVVAPPITVAEIVEAAASGDVVVPVHPAFGQGVEMFRQAASEACVDCRVMKVAAIPDADAPPPSSTASAPALPILFVGREREHREVYPAARSSLLNAAETAGIALDLRFVDPLGIGQGGAIPLDAVAGVLLPGGSDMANVPGQIRVAREAIQQRVPVLGLCLGMQTMTTAFAQTVLGVGSVNLEEAEPAAPIKSFAAMAEDDELPVHRTGEHAVAVLPGTRLHAVVGVDTLRIRCNHRYRLSPELRPRLTAAGLTVNAASLDDRVVDGVEWPNHPFFLGLQGHPELGRPGGPQSRVFTAFLSAALNFLRSNTKDGN